MRVVNQKQGMIFTPCLIDLCRCFCFGNSVFCFPVNSFKVFFQLVMTKD